MFFAPFFVRFQGGWRIIVNKQIVDFVQNDNATIVIFLE